MRNLLAEKSKYYKNFADSVYNQYRNIKYGIASCKKNANTYLDEVRKELVDYQAKDDGDALTQVSINTMGWLPVYYSTQDESCDYMPPWCDMSKYQIQTCNRGPQTVGMNYNNTNISTNLIEVNTGGCITRININPAININNGTSYTHTQATLATVWTITHNLGYAPNVWTVDENGNNISGTVAVVNNNQITITFSTSVKGTAYLS